MSEWRWTQLTGAENQRKRKSLRDCINKRSHTPQRHHNRRNTPLAHVVDEILSKCRGAD